MSQTAVTKERKMTTPEHRGFPMSTKLVPTDLNHPATGEALYVQMREPTRWQYFWRGLSLFLWLACVGGLGLRTAFEVARIVHSYRHDRRVWLSAPGESITALKGATEC